MKKIKHLVALALLSQLFLSSCCGNKNLLKEAKTIDVDTVFKKVYEATQEAMKEVQGNKWTPNDITLTFNNVTTVEGEVGLKIIVVKTKVKGSAAHGNKSVFTFKRDTTASAQGLMEDAKTRLFKRHLVAVLKSANATTGNEKFKLDEVEVETEFAVTGTLSTEGEWELVPVGPSFSASASHAVTHTITIKLTKAAKKKAG